MNAPERQQIEAKVLKRVKQAMMVLITRQTFFATLALYLKLAPSWWHQTAATDGKHLYYNPSFIETLSDPELRGLICHEVLHIANGHPWRRDSRDPGLFNVACDYAINPIILDAQDDKLGTRMVLPAGALLDPQYARLSAEQIYAKLREQKQSAGQCQKPGQGQSQSGSGDQSNDDDEGQGQSQSGSGDQSNDDDEGQGNSQGQGQGNGSGKPGNQASDGQDGEESRDPRAPNYKPTFGEVIDAPKASAAEDEATWRQRVQQAAQVAKMQGMLPAALERMVTEFVEARVDWRAVLRRFVQNLAALDYDWRMPSPRYAASGMYLPKLRSELMPPIVIGVDTSGSIGREELAAFTAEVSSIIEEVRPETTHVVFCDAEVGSVQEFQPGDPLVYKPTGGGGTDFRPVFDWVTEQGIEPACLIYLTDCYGTYPDEEPGYPVLWASSTKLDSLRGYEPKFGEALYIGE